MRSFHQNSNFPLHRAAVPFFTSSTCRPIRTLRSTRISKAHPLYKLHSIISCPHTLFQIYHSLHFPFRSKHLFYLSSHTFFSFLLRFVIVVSISDPTFFNPNSIHSMANFTSTTFSTLLFLLFSILVNISSADPPAPTPAPQLPPKTAPASAPSPLSPSLVPTPTPTPAPSHSHSSPAPSPANTPTPSPSPVPSPDDASDGGVNHSNVPGGDGKSSSGGMSAGKKAGIAIGVIIGVGVVTMGALVYRKRRQNIQRAQFGNAARRELL